MPFRYFVILADMRTGSNFLEASLNSYEDLQCYGEIFHPKVVGHQDKAGLFGVSLEERENDPFALIDLIIDRTEGLPGFRLFSNHDPRVLDHVLSDPECAKIILTRNPLESYVSLKIASETGQWMLADAKQRRDAKIVFDFREFRNQLEARRAHQSAIKLALQRSGQTAFEIRYEDLADPKILNGLALFLGAKECRKTTAKKTKKQNPAGLEEKVSNYAEMVHELAKLNLFDLEAVQDFETSRGPRVRSYFAGRQAPLIYMPVAGGPTSDILRWLAALDNAEVSELLTDLSQSALRSWKQENPGHRSFTVISHPLERAYQVFLSKVLARDDPAFEEPRETMRSRYAVCVPVEGALGAYSMDDHKDAFTQYLKFVKANLSGQTSVRIDPFWASQSALLQGFATMGTPDRVLRARDLERDLTLLAAEIGCQSQDYAPHRCQEAYPLSAIYDARLEKLCQQAYRRDYINFGFCAWAEDGS